MGLTGWPLIQLGITTPAVPPEVRSTFAPFWETWNLVNERYFDQPLDPEILTQGAIEGMLGTLEDPHTRYLAPAAEEAARSSMEGEIQGIGVLVEYRDGNVTVVSPFEGSPAEEAGIEPGDILREADGVDLTGMNLDDAAELIRGPAGTTVHLVIERDGSLVEIDVRRDVIEVPSVRGEMLEENIAYVRLNRFGNRTTDELQSLLEELLAQDPRGLILDLRNNPGGGLGTSVDVADEFLPEGTVLLERFGSGRERVYESTDAGLAQEIPMVVLINEGSASASEVLAGALRDRDRATLIGVTSFGKGTVQEWHGLSNGGGVRFTIARWLTPDGTWVHEEGISPDQVVPLPETAEGEDSVDIQLDAAIEHLTTAVTESDAGSGENN
jgi:carboxyl-terminal processing protease